LPALDWLLDPTSGDLALAETPGEALAILRDLLPPPRARDCARPFGTARLVLPDAELWPGRRAQGPFVRIHGLAHGILGCGPGRRSVVQLQGCLRGCPGCGAPETHDPDSGPRLPAARVAELLLDPAGGPRDGVSILGGEPFLQPSGLAAILRSLRQCGSPHVILYSGDTWEELIFRGEREPDVAESLALVDWLVDGPFVRALTGGGTPWAGSRNQRLIDLAASRERGRAVTLELISLEETDGHNS
jgi:anaerobic ribonucleoside-triphosphate reductase activating protein